VTYYSVSWYSVFRRMYSWVLWTLKKKVRMII